MILKSLYDYAKAQSDMPPRGMERKEIEFVIVIDADGNFKRFEHRRIDKKKCASFLVAKGVKRTSAPKSNILWDNGKYVLGKGDKNGKCNSLFVEIVKDIAAKHPDDDSIQALLKFYYKPLKHHYEEMKADELFSKVDKANTSNFSFRYEPDDMLIAEKKNLFEHLLELDLEENSKDFNMGRCLITGTYGPIVRLSTPTPLPGNQATASLVSFQTDSGYDSYGKEQVYNAPISIDADEAYSSVLKKFIGKDSSNKVRLGDRMFLFWGTGKKTVCGEVEGGLMSIMTDNPDEKTENLDEKIGKVTKLFKSIFSGEIKTTLDDRFHILGLMPPNKGRISVVLWMECDLKDFAKKILLHFEDMEVATTNNTKQRHPSVGVYSMVKAVTRDGQITDKFSRNLIEETVKSVIMGTPYPFPLYTGALQLIKASLFKIIPKDIKKKIENECILNTRIAIIKAYINRKFRNNNQHKPLQVMLDKKNSNPGYLCGRLTAVLEKIQADAQTGDSIRTRYMGAASATPATVMPAMLNLSMHHSEKLSSKGIRIHYEKLKQDIITLLPANGFPAHLDLNDQGRFFVGYFHQRADLYTKKEN